MAYINNNHQQKVKGKMFSQKYVEKKVWYPKKNDMKKMKITWNLQYDNVFLIPIFIKMVTF